jgi:hypothetical protein
VSPNQPPSPQADRAIDALVGVAGSCIAFATISALHEENSHRDTSACIFAPVCHSHHDLDADVSWTSFFSQRYLSLEDVQ